MDTHLIERHLAVDLHKAYLVVGGVNPQQEVVLSPRRMELSAWPKWAAANLHASDVLVVEATGNAWTFYDQTVAHVGRVLVANARKVALIAQARVKTDKLDVLKLARLSVANLIPEVWVPPQYVRELRGLLSHRQQVVKRQTMLKNRLQSLLHQQQVPQPAGDLFAAKQRDWWEGLPLNPTQKLQMRHDLEGLTHLHTQLQEIDDELRRLSTSAPWAEHVTYLMQLPGIGLIHAMTLLAAIGEVTRFTHAKQLVGYSGLGAGVHDSGQTHRNGHITKEGRRDLRRVMVEAAWIAVETHPHWKAEFAHLTHHLPKHKAIVAIARKLLVVVWHVLSERAADRHADPDMVAFKLMTWCWKLTPEQRGGLTTRQACPERSRRVVRYHLLRLQLGDELTLVIRGGARHLIASTEEVLALKPEREVVT